MATLGTVGDLSMPSEGVASYYDNSSVDPRWGGATKSGEKFDENKLTAAVPPKYWKKYKGKTLEVSNGDKTVSVTVNDTGGFEKYGRAIDLSKAAFKALGETKLGTLKVKIKEK
jgi:rare lipoprotein A